MKLHPQNPTPGMPCPPSTTEQILDVLASLTSELRSLVWLDGSARRRVDDIHTKIQDIRKLL